MKKQSLIIIILVVVAILATAGFLFYGSLNKNVSPKQEEQIIDNNQPENNTQPENDIQPKIIEDIEIQAEPVDNGSQQGMLFVCMDKCGDNVCEKIDSQCNDMNCACPEDAQSCPEDCK